MAPANGPARLAVIFGWRAGVSRAGSGTAAVYDAVVSSGEHRSGGITGDAASARSAGSAGQRGKDQQGTACRGCAVPGAAPPARSAGQAAGRGPAGVHGGVRGPSGVLAPAELGEPRRHRRGALGRGEPGDREEPAQPVQAKAARLTRVPRSKKSRLSPAMLGMPWPIPAGCLSAPLDGNPRAGSMITKDRCTYSMRILRQEQILRDHGGPQGRPTLIRQVLLGLKRQRMKGNARVAPRFPPVSCPPGPAMPGRVRPPTPAAGKPGLRRSRRRRAPRWRAGRPAGRRARRRGCRGR